MVEAERYRIYAKRMLFLSSKDGEWLRRSDTPIQRKWTSCKVVCHKKRQTYSIKIGYKPSIGVKTEYKSVGGYKNMHDAMKWMPAELMFKLQQLGRGLSPGSIVESDSTTSSNTSSSTESNSTTSNDDTASTGMSSSAKRKRKEAEEVDDEKRGQNQTII